jgi:hypothetical protein
MTMLSSSFASLSTGPSVSLSCSKSMSDGDNDLADVLFMDEPPSMVRRNYCHGIVANCWRMIGTGYIRGRRIGERMVIANDISFR